MKNLVILGGGTAGTMMANKMARALPDKEWRITVVDKDDVHVYQPGLLFLPFGDYQEHDILKPRGAQLDSAVRYIVAEIDRVDPVAHKVALKEGEPLPFDLLVVATGTDIYPDETPGLMGPRWQKDVFDFYTLQGASALQKRLASFDGGKLVVNLVDMPIKCPVAPLEFTFLADAFFEERNLRHKVDLVYVTPLDGAFTKPKASKALGAMMTDRNIEVVANFNASELDNGKKVLRAYDGREMDFDLLVTVPLHGGSSAIRGSSLGDDFGFVPTHQHTLQSLQFPDIFVLGDATNLPTSKAGAVAHFQGDVLYTNLMRFIQGEPLLEEFDGHSNCFIETGHGKAMIIDFNYETEPLPGRFPLPGAGPFTLLEESHVNHWGKLAFKWVYWNFLVAGRELPLTHRMQMAGKWS